jgi:hypothetical protein
MSAQRLHRQPPVAAPTIPPSAQPQLAYTASHPPPQTMIYDNSIGSMGSVQYVPVQYAQQYAPVVRCYPVLLPSGQHGVVQQQYRSAGELRVAHGVPGRPQGAPVHPNSIGERSQPRLVSYATLNGPPGAPQSQGHHVRQVAIPGAPHVVPTAHTAPARVLTELSPAEVRAMRAPHVQPAPAAVVGVSTMVAAVPHSVRGARYQRRPHNGGSQQGSFSGPVQYMSDPHGMRRHLVRQVHGASAGSRASTMLHDSFATVSDIGDDGNPMLAALDPNHHPQAVYRVSSSVTGHSNSGSFSSAQPNRTPAAASAPNPYMTGGARRCANPFAVQVRGHSMGRAGPVVLKCLD